MVLRDSAVSPVIGVLLMLTLTLIIAAIVNSYAGGLVETERKAPAVTLQVTYSQSEGMEIRHVSGDPLPTSMIRLVVKPSETFGRNASRFSSIVDKKYITNHSGDESWEEGISSVRPGEVFQISHKNLSYLQSVPESRYWFNESDNQGNTFLFEVYYRNTMICRNEVLIER